jgi:amino acid transporter
MTTNNENMGYKQELKRVLTLKDLAIYGIAFMTPIAPAYIYGSVTEITGGTLAMAYVIATVAMLFTAYSYGHMAAAFPVAGSTYTYTQRELTTTWLSIRLGDVFRLCAGSADCVYGRSILCQCGRSGNPLLGMGPDHRCGNNGCKLFWRTDGGKNQYYSGWYYGAIVVAFIVICAYAVTQGAGQET